MQPPTSDFDLNLFKQRLNETILWCRYKIAQSPTHTSEILWSLSDPVDSYRSISHRPNVRLTEHAATIFARRSQLVTALPPQPAIDGSLMGGRLLMFDSGGTLSDGAAESESNDFFDADNVPACDTWVYKLDEYVYYPHIVSHMVNYPLILSWVPPEYRHEAEEGVSVNPEQCIRWLDDMVSWWPDQYQPAYLAQLKAAGFA